MIKVCHILLSKVWLLSIDLLFCFLDLVVILCWSKQCYTVKQLSYSGSELKNWGALHLNLWKPLSPCQREIRSVDNPNIFNFVLSDTEEMCQQWGPTASKHRSLTSNNLDSTSPPVLSHWRSATFISFRSRSVDQKWRLSPHQTQNDSGENVFLGSRFLT